jgi:hypothetical protein
MDWVLRPDWCADHEDLLDRLGVPIDFDEEAGELHCHWTRSTARAYQLLHVFVHELGHHIDRMTSRGQRESSRGEDHAEQYAWSFEAVIWENYCAEFGVPE